MGFKLSNHIIGKTYDLTQENMSQMIGVIEKLRDALVSISKNSCCDQCQEAKLVAISALYREDET